MIQESNGYTYYKYDYSENCSWAVLKNGFVPRELLDVYRTDSVWGKFESIEAIEDNTQIII